MNDIYDKDFYINTINVMNFLYDNTKIRKIVFKDKIEYRKYKNSNEWVYHNLQDAAIIRNDNTREYYIDGKRYYNDIDFKKKATVLLRNKKLKNIIKIKK